MAEEGQEKPGVKTHGVSGYKRGCRCEKCRVAKRARNKEEYEKRLRAAEADGASFEHGYAGFTHRGCRCEVCCSAKAVERMAPSRQPGRRRRNAKRNGQTLEQAVRWGREWTGPELELAARTDLTVRQIARMIGRSYYAVSTKRRLLRLDPKTIAVAGIPNGLPSSDGEE